MKSERTKLEQQIRQLTDRIIETNTPSVIAVYKNRINELERQKIVIDEKLVNDCKLRNTFDETFRTGLLL